MADEAKVASATAKTVPKQLTPWKPGQSGNPKGRPANAKQKLSDSFLADMLAAWERDGKKAIERVIEERPHEFIKTVAAILPKDINIRKEVVQELSDDDLTAALIALRSASALASAREGSETTARH
jgi:Family of unknown function (DUF5681)